jgi:hypothetical protein
MANTVIELKFSQTPSATPATLANGEISINTNDGKFFYKDPSGTIRAFDRYPGPSGLDKEIQFNDSGTLGANASLTFDKTTGNLYSLSIKSGSYIEFGDGTKQYTANAGAGGGGVTSVAGATGAVSNTQLLDGIKTVDGTGSGLDADLLDGLNSTSFANSSYATAAFDKANLANVLAQASFDKANTDTTSVSITANNYGSASIVPVFRAEANGRISSIANAAIAIDTSQVTSGTLPIARGGTNQTSFTAGQRIFFNGTALASLANLTQSVTGGLSAANTITSITFDVRSGGVTAYTGAAIAIDTSQITSGTLASARLSGAYTGITGVGTLTNGTWTANSISTTYTDAKITSVGAQTGAISNTQILNFVKAVDGTGSGLDADLLDGLNSTSFGNSVFTQAAFDKANTDVTSVSVSAGTYGNSTIIPVITLAANGRVTAVSNTTITASEGIQTYSSNVGDGTNTSFTITHSLNKSNIIVNVRENANGYFVYPDIKYTSVNAVVLEFVDAPTSNQYFVSVFG